MGHDGFGSDRLGRDGFCSTTGSAAMGLAATGSAAADAAGGPSMQFLLQLVKGFLRTVVGRELNNQPFGIEDVISVFLQF